jgi:hypothetical protein
MPIYTVHEPPLRWREDRRGPENFRFVRDGFHFWAFLLAPFWMLRHRLWLVFLLYILLISAIGIAMHFAGIRGGGSALISILISFLVGMEAGSLRRWTLRRWKWIDGGTVSADNLEAAERRFFDAWTAGGAAPTAIAPAPASPSYPASSYRPPAAAPDIVGLFPEPRTPR